MSSATQEQPNQLGSYQATTWGVTSSCITDDQLRILLRRELAKAGCFQPAPFAQSVHMLAVVAVYVGGYAMLLSGPTIGVRLLGCGMVAVACVQAAFVSHEASHGATTTRRWLGELIGQIFESFLNGVAFSHYQYTHRSHHPHCNETAKDTDIQSHLVSLYPDAARRKRTAAGHFIVRNQANLIWPLITLQALGVKMDSFLTMCRDPVATRVDWLAVALHYVLWFGPPIYILGLLDAFSNYGIIAGVAGVYLGLVLLPNHIGTRVIGPDESLPVFRQTLITTRNLGASIIEDIVFGGVNNHVEHHLFSTIPSVRLRQARVITRQFCRQHNLPYREMNWVQGMREVYVYLDEVGRLAGE